MANVNKGFGQQAQPTGKELSTTSDKARKNEMLQRINGMRGQFAKALPAVMTPERFTRIALTAFSTNPGLQHCDFDSFIGAMLQAAQLGLEPNTPLGQAYLIPYGNQCQFQLGYKGLLDLAWRSGEITDISAHEVYENDGFEYELGLTPKLVHKPALRNRGQIVGYYAVFHTKSGGYGVEVMSKEDVEKFAKAKSKAYSSGPWKTDFDAMAKKTVVKRVLKYAPLKSDFIRAMDADGTIKSEISENMLDLPDETVTIDAEAQTPQEAPAPNLPPLEMQEEEIPMPGDEYVDRKTGEVRRA